MKLEKVREEVYYFSQKASDANQKLAIAGVALIWLFRSGTKENIQFPHLLFFALTLFIVSLIIDILHYSIFAPIWSIHYKNEYNRISSANHANADIEQTDVKQPNTGNILGWILFYGKLAFLIIGYISFFIYLLDNIEII